jgi:hypothetical protein
MLRRRGPSEQEDIYSCTKGVPRTLRRILRIVDSLADNTDDHALGRGSATDLRTDFGVVLAVILRPHHRHRIRRLGKEVGMGIFLDIMRRVERDGYTVEPRWPTCPICDQKADTYIRVRGEIVGCFECATFEDAWEVSDV